MFYSKTWGCCVCVGTIFPTIYLMFSLLDFWWFTNEILSHSLKVDNYGVLPSKSLFLPYRKKVFFLIDQKNEKKESLYFKQYYLCDYYLILKKQKYGCTESRCLYDGKQQIL